MEKVVIVNQFEKKNVNFYLDILLSNKEFLESLTMEENKNFFFQISQNFAKSILEEKICSSESIIDEKNAFKDHLYLV